MSFAEKEKKARLRYVKNLAKQHKKTVQKERKKSNKICDKFKSNTWRKLTCDRDETAVLEQDDIVTKPFCQAYYSTEQDDEEWYPEDFGLLFTAFKKTVH